MQSASRYINRSATTNFPRRNARSPQRRVNRLRVRGIESKIGGASVFVLVENFLESLRTVGGAENAAFSVRCVSMTLCPDEKAVRILRAYQDRPHLFPAP